MTEEIPLDANEGSVYIRDYDANLYIDVGKTKVPRELFIGPFDSEAKALEYLIAMNLVDKGVPLPKGYSLVKVFLPSKAWKSHPDDVYRPFKKPKLRDGQRRMQRKPKKPIPGWARRKEEAKRSKK